VPLRTRLVLLLVVLGAAALFVTDAITYNSLKSSLFAQTDQSLQQSSGPLSRALFGEPRPGACVGSPIGTFAEAYTTNLSPFAGVVCVNYNTVSAPSAPRIPASEISAADVGNKMVFTTVESDGVSYRVLIEPILGNPPFVVLAFGVPLTGVDATLRHHLRVDLTVSLLVLLALVLATWALVWLGLRPLEQMAQTAGEIAAGDLSRRVEDTDERTEVGQLGAALNAMLSQIERAFREREASEERLRRFVGDVSHELRTPLTSIRGYAELFKDGGNGRAEDLNAALERIESESTRMGGLVDDLLLLARLDQGRPLGQESVDLAQLAADAVQDARAVDPLRPIRLLSSGPCVVVGDEERLRQVLGNLLSNALTYTPPGSPIEVAVHMDRAPVDVSGLPGTQAIPTVGMFGRLSRSGRAFEPANASDAPARPLGAADLRVAGAGGAGGEKGAKSDEAYAGAAPRPAWRSDVAEPAAARPGRADRSVEQGGRVIVSVIDHGPGIPPEARPYVFERFWREDQSRQRSSGGTGLGLSIVAAVVAAHGGQVAIRETPGGGATFVVELPAAPAAAPAPPPAQSPPSSSSASSSSPASSSATKASGEGPVVDLALPGWVGE